MNIQNIKAYLEEAQNYVGKNHYNLDGSTFSLTPSSELLSKYDLLRKNLERQDPKHKVSWIPKNWSLEISQLSNGTPKKNPISQHLSLSKIDDLCQDRYLIADLSPEDVAHFPSNTLGGAYFQYMDRGKFYEFDKNPLIPNSDIKWFIRLLRQTHDFYHLITEIYHYGWDGGFLVYDDPQCYERDLLVLSEEMCLHAFLLGQVRLKAVIPTIAEWVNTSLYHCSAWLKEAYPLWLQTHNYEFLKKQFCFPSFIANCEQWMYASFKLGRLETQICVDEYLEELDSILEPLPSHATPEQQAYRDMLLESFERGLRSRPLVCFQWDRYLGNKLQDVRDFLNIPPRQTFQENSHYLDADLC